MLPWVPEVFLACGGNFRCWLDRNWNCARKVSGTQGRKVCGNPRISWQIFKFLNSYIFFNIGPIDTNLEIFADRNVLFLTMWVLCCLSHNTRTRYVLSPPWFEIRPCAPLRAGPLNASSALHAQLGYFFHDFLKGFAIIERNILPKYRLNFINLDMSFSDWQNSSNSCRSFSILVESHPKRCPIGD